MKGSLQLKRGTWHAVISYKDEGGSFKHKWISTGLTERGNKKAAKEILDQELKKFEQELALSKEKIERRGKPKEIDKSDATMLFSDYCKKYIISIENKISSVVYSTYMKLMSRIKDFFDSENLRLIDITSEEIKAFYKFLKDKGAKNITLKHYACVLRPALRQAYKDKLIPDNPYEFLDPIKTEKTTLEYYDKNELAKFFEVIEGNKYELAFKMAAYYGFRRSELLGLRWSAIDFEHKRISINHKVLVVDKKVELSDELKTKTSRRTLPLVPAMEKLLIRQKQEIEENKNFYGNTYDKQYLDYVFVDEKGKIIYPDRLSDNFEKTLKDNNLKRIRFHDLRHSCASLMLANGVQMKQIQDWLGHANFATTADVYSHLDFNSKVQSANIIANALEVEKNEENVQSKETLIKQMLKEMAEQGFENINDYLEYLNSSDEKQLLNNKNNYSM